MIDTTSLRNKILDMAFQGKLTNRRNSDSSVKDIIARCQKDKDVSISQGKYKKEPFRGAVENVQICDIPSSWIWMYISDMSLFQEGPGILGKDFRKEGIPLIRIAGMNGNTVRLKGCNYLDPQMVKEKWDHFRLDIGDVLISTSASLDRIAEVDEEAEGAIPYTGLIRFKMYGGISKDYFKWFIKSSYYIGQVDSQKKGGFIQHYGPTHLRKMLIPIPPIEEQERIVSKLNEIFAHIDTISEAQTEFMSDIEVLSRKLSESAIRGELVDQHANDENADLLFAKIIEQKKLFIKEGRIKKEKETAPIREEEIPFEIPRSWKWVRLSDISYRIWAGGDKPADFSEECNDQMCVPVVANGVTNEGILGYTERATAPHNTITVAGRGTIGFTVYREYDYCPIVRLIVIEQSEYIEPRYLKIFLQSMPESSVGSSIPQLTVPMIRPKLVPLPPLEEQKRIADKMEEYSEIINGLSDRQEA